jgi:BASS family bile acid:Na+ symporter
MIQCAISLFPLWALLAAAAAWIWPEAWVGFRGSIAPLLGVVMLGMGMTLEVRDFARVLERPGLVALGVAMQYAIMPSVGWAISVALGLPAQLAAGIVLVGSCPGGTASNVVCYLARGDVALSITLTTVSTLLAIGATPTLTWIYVGERIEVPVLGMVASVLKIVILPVLVGVVVNTVWGRRLAPLKRGLPLLSVIAIVVIIAIVVGLNRDGIGQLLGLASAAVMTHNLLGLALGYGVARALGRSRSQSRTLAIEVGMQNSGLGVALATAHLTPAAALPGAFFSVWHNLSGACLAGWWSRRPPGHADTRYRS